MRSSVRLPHKVCPTCAKSCSSVDSIGQMCSCRFPSPWARGATGIEVFVGCYSPDSFAACHTVKRRAGRTARGPHPSRIRSRPGASSRRVGPATGRPPCIRFRAAGATGGAARAAAHVPRLDRPAARAADRARAPVPHRPPGEPARLPRALALQPRHGLVRARQEPALAAALPPCAVYLARSVP